MFSKNWGRVVHEKNIYENRGEKNCNIKYLCLQMIILLYTLYNPSVTDSISKSILLHRIIIFKFSGAKN